MTLNEDVYDGHAENNFALPSSPIEYRCSEIQEGKQFMRCGSEGVSSVATDAPESEASTDHIDSADEMVTQVECEDDSRLDDQKACPVSDFLPAKVSMMSSRPDNHLAAHVPEEPAKVGMNMFAYEQEVQEPLTPEKAVRKPSSRKSRNHAASEQQVYAAQVAQWQASQWRMQVAQWQQTQALQMAHMAQFQSSQAAQWQAVAAESWKAQAAQWEAKAKAVEKAQ
jgi:hypothetical protein